MSDNVGSTAGITPLGQPGLPVFFGAVYEIPSLFNPQYLQNLNPGYAVITQIDACETPPNENDALTVSYHFAPYQIPLWSTTVGAGHSGTFYDVWRGMFLLGHNLSLEFDGTASGGSSWYATVSGYFIPLVPSYSLSWSQFGP